MIPGIAAGQMLTEVDGGGGGGESAAYWRVNVTAVHGGSYISIQEIEMRATIGGADQCTGGTASSSSDLSVDHDAENAFDNGAASESWISNAAAPGWIQYHFASAVVVSELSIKAESGYLIGLNCSPKDFSLQYSDDGAAWADSFVVVATPAWSSSETRTFSA